MWLWNSTERQSSISSTASPIVLVCGFALPAAEIMILTVVGVSVQNVVRAVILNVAEVVILHVAAVVQLSF